MSEKFEIEIDAKGVLRTIYKDETFPDLQRLGKTKVERASNVEWEDGGWTVRAAHDTSLAIRFSQVTGFSVGREGDIAKFASRDLALKVEESCFWELLKSGE